MEFSQVIKHSSLCRFSPDGRFLATNEKYRLIVRDARSLEIVQIFTCLDAISRIEWSPDSQMLLAAQYKRALVQMFSLERPTWVCRIDEGPVGLTYARWAPDSRHVLTSSDFSLRLTIWSLVDRSSAYIRQPKFAAKGCEFSHDGRFLAVVERREYKDMIGIYATDTWELVKHFAVDTVDLEDLAWSPDDRFIAIWDTPLEYKLLVYSPLGRKQAEFQAYENALGIKGLVWSPTSQFLAVGSYDEVARVFSNLTWRALVEYTHLPQLTSPSLVIYHEEIDAADVAAMQAQVGVLNASVGAKSLTSTKPVRPAAATAQAPAEPINAPTRYAILDPPVTPTQIKPESDKPNPRLGVGLMEWSHDSRFLATRNDNMPNCVWIWETSKLSLVATVMQLEGVRALHWHPSASRLAICAGNSKLYLWSEEGCSIVAVPIPGMNVQNLKWSANGRALLLIDRDQCCLCYLEADADDAAQPLEEEEELSVISSVPHDHVSQSASVSAGTDTDVFSSSAVSSVHEDDQVSQHSLDSEAAYQSYAAPSQRSTSDRSTSSRSSASARPISARPGTASRQPVSRGTSRF